MCMDCRSDGDERGVLSCGAAKLVGNRKGASASQASIFDASPSPEIHDTMHAPIHQTYQYIIKDGASTASTTHRRCWRDWDR
jgi:hypothetical protein